MQPLFFSPSVMCFFLFTVNCQTFPERFRSSSFVHIGPKAKRITFQPDRSVSCRFPSQERSFNLEFKSWCEEEVLKALRENRNRHLNVFITKTTTHETICWGRWQNIHVEQRIKWTMWRECYEKYSKACAWALELQLSASSWICFLLRLLVLFFFF